MTIQVNGESRSCPDSSTILELLAELGFKDQPVLVELNGQPVHQREHQSIKLKDGDTIELVRFVAGG
ncbi:MAG: sulfur carrier protein ThiS [Verrucomicrobiota bacterium]